MSIQRRPNGKWRARFRDESGQEHARHFDRKLDAQRWLDEITADRVTGRYVDPRAGRIALRAHAERYQSRLVGGEAQHRLTDNALRVHILPALGDQRLDRIRQGDVQELVRSLKDKLSPASIRNVHQILAAVLDSAVADKLIPDNPARGVTLPRARRDEVHPPATAAVHKLAAAFEPDYAVGVWVLAGSGIRIGELLGLRVEDVDFEAAELRVRRQRRQDGKVVPPKTDTAARTIPLGNTVLSAVKDHVAEDAPIGASGWLLTGDEPDGGLGYRRWRTLFDTALGAAGLTGQLSTHDLRHYFASVLISGGASVRSVQLLLGHASATTTLSIYSHLWPGEQDRTRGLVDAALRTTRGQQ